MFNLTYSGDISKLWYFYDKYGSCSQVFYSKKEAIETLVQICGNITFISLNGDKSWPMRELRLTSAYHHLVKLSNNIIFFDLDVREIKSN